MTPREELIRRLRNRYDEQCHKFPKTSELGWKLYMRANLAGTMRNDRAMWARDGHGALEMYA